MGSGNKKLADTKMGCCACHERPNLASEARDESKAPEHNRDWVERMLMDIGLDLTCVARDFPRMSIATDKISPPPHTDDFQARLVNVRKALRAIIQMSESGVEGIEGAHYYTLKAAALGSPVNIASTNADTEETLRHEDGEGGDSVLKKSSSHRNTSTPPPNISAEGSPLNGGKSPTVDTTVTNESTATNATLTLTFDNLAQVPVGKKL
eukprot:GILI01045287.1.p1 GENE.GILI01045287.1~~GILI01045287.1.p1  ORF type:complete len:209 (+),score=42.97 GILI01045287.1:26-652(+)